MPHLRDEHDGGGGHGEGEERAAEQEHDPRGAQLTHGAHGLFCFGRGKLG
jgi:hypothetical protein